MDKAKVRLQVSLDGTTEPTNDSIRGGGVFQKASEGLKALSVLGFETSLTAVVTQENLQELKKLPELAEKDQSLHDAMQERTISGALRRAIHSSKVLLPDLADRAQTDMDTLDAFLTGERPLTSDIIDRLTKILKLKLEAIGSK